MDKKFLLKLAYKNLMTHRLRTILTLLGVIIGVSAVVFLVSFGSGIERLVTEQITGADAFQLIDVGTGNFQIVKLDDPMINKIKDFSGVKNVEITINIAAKAKKDNNAMDTAFFGTAAAYLDWSGKKIKAGKNLENITEVEQEKKVIVNTAYLDFLGNDKLESYIGQKVIFDVIVPKEFANSGEAKTYENQEFKIIGVIKDDSPPSAYINYANFAPYDTNAFSQAKVRVTDRSKVDMIRKQIEALGLKTQYVGDTVSQVEQVFAIFKIILGSFGIIALLVALLGMFNTLTISLLERIKEVALMKILGMSRRDIRDLFVAEALSLGLVGGILGIILGMILGLIANGILNFFATRAGGESVSVFYYSFTFILAVIIVAVLVGFVTGIYPARRAAKINPLDILRYE